MQEFRAQRLGRQLLAPAGCLRQIWTSAGVARLFQTSLCVALRTRWCWPTGTARTRKPSCCRESCTCVSACACVPNGPNRLLLWLASPSCNYEGLESPGRNLEALNLNCVPCKFEARNNNLSGRSFCGTSFIQASQPWTRTGAAAGTGSSSIAGNGFSAGVRGGGRWSSRLDASAQPRRQQLQQRQAREPAALAGGRSARAMSLRKLIN